jgi:hypothetical protein
MTFEPHSFEFLLDDSAQPVIGLKVNSVRGGAVTIPMLVETAETVGSLLLAHVHHIRRH